MLMINTKKDNIQRPIRVYIHRK